MHRIFHITQKTILNDFALDYSDVGHRWSPLWAGSAADIGYYVKNLKNMKKDKR